MWSRSELKERAKEVLRKSYWKAFLVSLIIAFAGGGSGSSGTGGKRFVGDLRRGNQWGYYNSDFGGYGLPVVATIVIFIVIIAIAVAFAFRIFLGYSLEVGGRRYFVQSAQGNTDMNNIGYSFKSGRYMPVIKTMLWRDLLLFLWTLLFIIPGIIKGFAYSMVPYILADNPSIGYKRAVELSNQMTQGEKFDILILKLSFLGWYILGTFALVVGVVFVMPYENSTEAELYLVLKQNAIDAGLCDRSELTYEEADMYYR